MVAIYSQAKRASLLSLIENFWVRIGPVLHHIQFHQITSNVAVKHDKIIQALAARDTEATEQAIVDDLVSAAHVVVKEIF